VSHAGRDYAPTRHHVTYRARILALHLVGCRTAIAHSRGTAMPDGADPNRFLLVLLKPARIYICIQLPELANIIAIY